MARLRHKWRRVPRKWKKMFTQKPAARARRLRMAEAICKPISTQREYIAIGRSVLLMNNVSELEIGTTNT